MYLNLKLCLLQSGIRQNRLAQIIKIDEALLSKIINGFRKPTPAQRKCLASFLGKDEAWLFTPYYSVKLDKSNSGSSEWNSV